MPRHLRLCRVVGLLLPMLALAACKTPSAQTEKAWMFACPEPASRVAYDSGRVLTFTGTDPADRTICLAQGGGGPGGAPVRLAWGLVEETTSEGRGHQPGMASLFPSKAGSNASYTATVSSPGSGIQYPYETRWRVVGFEKLEVPAGKFDAVVLERLVAGTGANAAQTFTVRYWLDGVSGIALKRTVELGRGGSSLLGNLMATQVTLPPPPPRQGAPLGPPPAGS